MTGDSWAPHLLADTALWAALAGWKIFSIAWAPTVFWLLSSHLSLDLADGYFASGAADKQRLFLKYLGQVRPAGMW